MLGATRVSSRLGRELMDGAGFAGVGCGVGLEEAGGAPAGGWGGCAGAPAPNAATPPCSRAMSTGTSCKQEGALRVGVTWRVATVPGHASLAAYALCLRTETDGNDTAIIGLHVVKCYC